VNRFYIDDSDEKKLNVILQDKVRGYLNYSFPLCSILWYQGNCNWFHEHFIQIYSMESPSGYLWMDYLEELYFYKDVLDSEFIDEISAFAIYDIIEYLKLQIAEGNYLLIFLDRYYIKDKSEFDNSHEPLQVFLYGYDDKTNLFHSIGFDKNRRFTYTTLSYEEVRKGFRSVLTNFSDASIWEKLYTIIKLRPKFNDNYVCQLNKIWNNLYNYFYGIGDKTLLRPEIIIERGSEAIYGIKCNDELIKHLHNLSYGRHTMDYRYVHMLTEQKINLYDNLKFLIVKLDFGAMYLEELEKYQDVIMLFNKSRILYSKGILRDRDRSSIYDKLKDKKIIETVIKNLTKAQELEYEIIHRIVDKFESRYKR
jgi:hypothetical protein